MKIEKDEDIPKIFQNKLNALLFESRIVFGLGLMSLCCHSWKEVPQWVIDALEDK